MAATARPATWLTSEQLQRKVPAMKNPALFAAIERAAAPIRVRHFDEVYFDGEAKEAVAFALLGYLHVMKRPGNVPSATGARGKRTLGKLTPA